LQTSPPDTSLLRLPLARRFPLCSLLLPPPLTAGAGPRAPPPAATPVHASSPLNPDLFPLPWWSCARAPRRPEPSPAATSSSPWTAHCRTLIPSLSHAAAPLQHLHAVLLLPAPNSEHLSHIFPRRRPLPLRPRTAARGQPTPDPLRLNQHLHKLPCCLLHLRPHRGQLALSLSTPPRYPSQHHIIPVKLPDPSSDSLVHHCASPTLAGVLLRRRRLCLRRSPLIQCIFVQLVARTRSPCLTEARAQACCRRSPPEHCRRR
jgi:hypothetical protein